MAESPRTKGGALSNKNPHNGDKEITAPIPGYLLVIPAVAYPSEIPYQGLRLLPTYEADAYGPLVFPEQVQKFLDHEIEYLLKRQDPDGGWKSAEPLGNGRTRMQAGGTVDKVTLTAMCGYSLRKHPEHDPKRID